MVNSEGVDKRLYGRANLSLALLCHIVLEVLERRSTNIRLDISCLWLHRHKCCSHNALMVQNGVARSEQSIALALVGKDLHLALFVETCIYLFVVHARRLHIAEAVRVAHCSLDNSLFLLLGEV